MQRRTRRYRLAYMELWRLYYAVVIAGSGFAMAYVSLRGGNLAFAAGISVLTVAAVIVLLMWTFRTRRQRMRRTGLGR